MDLFSICIGDSHMGRDERDEAIYRHINTDGPGAVAVWRNDGTLRVYPNRDAYDSNCNACFDSGHTIPREVWDIVKRLAWIESAHTEFPDV